MTRVVKNSYPSIKDFNGTTGRFLRLVDPDNKKWSAFNPCIAYSPKYGYALTIRSSNYVISETTGSLEVTTGGLVKSEVWFAELDQETLELGSRRKIMFDGSGPSLSRGVEDARLFWRDDSWYFTAIMLEKEHTQYARVALYKYDQEKNLASFVEKYDGPDIFKPEKNWMLSPTPNPNFDFITGPTSIYKDGVFTSKPSTLKVYGGLRGNSNLLELGDGTYLSLVHTLYIKRSAGFNNNTYASQMGVHKKYTHQFARYDSYGKLVELSEEFFFDEFGIEFAMGLVEKGDRYVITYGAKDLTSHMAIIHKETVHNMLQPVEEIQASALMPVIL